MTKPFIYWKESGKQEIFTITNPVVKQIAEVELDTEGFILAPFNKKQPSYFFEGIISECQNTTFLSTIHELNSESIHLITKDYISLVKNGIDKIKNGIFQKVVLARSFSQSLPENFDLNNYFKKLCKIYDSAFIYCFCLNNEIWIGASPEVFLKKESDLLLTYALAGTMPATEEIAFGEKERYEQQFVKTYITNLLKENDAEEIIISEVSEINTGNLKHLINKINFKTANPLTIINKLHPTPAVCGTPLKETTNFISENENLNREYYSGFLGPIYQNKDFNFWVNLRCAKITNSLITFFAGAGIVKDSSPENEFQETERKMETLKKWL